MKNDPFAVWAPKADAGRAGARRSRRPTPPSAGWRWRPTAVVSGVRSEALAEPPADRPLDYGYLIDGGRRWCCPTRGAGGRRTGCTGCRAPSTRTRTSWSDHLWTGRQLPGGIVYELHVGTFTAEGTLRSAIGRLDHLVELGVTLVELMPVNAFNGSHGWGYDGVLWCAVQEEYGGPAAYQDFVDACHQRGLGVIQDVVYNHLGPSGNYLPEFGPYLFEGPSNTWGETLNLDGEDSDEVRRYIIDNALMWLREYHVDGLRLDAVHALSDARATHLLEELADRGGCAQRLRQPTAVADRRVGHEQPAADHHPGRRRLRADRAVERRLPPRPVRQPDRGHRRLLRRLRLAGGAGQGVRERLLPRRHALQLPRAQPRVQDRHPADADLAAGGLLRQPRPDRQPGRRSAPVRQAQPAAAGVWRRSSRCSARSPR